MTDSREPYNLNRPAHHITNDVLRRIEAICHENGLEVAFGVRVHNAINTLVEQYQELLANEDNWVETYDYTEGDVGQDGEI